MKIKVKYIEKVDLLGVRSCYRIIDYKKRHWLFKRTIRTLIANTLEDGPAFGHIPRGYEAWVKNFIEADNREFIIREICKDIERRGIDELEKCRTFRKHLNECGLEWETD